MRATYGLIVVLFLLLAGSAGATGTSHNVEIAPVGTSGMSCSGSPILTCTATADDAIMFINDILTDLPSYSQVTISSGSGGSQAGDILIDGPISYAGAGGASLALQSTGSVSGTHLIYSANSMGLSFQPGADSTYAGSIEGSISVAKKCGDGILVLTGANTYTGTTDISSGNILQVGSGGTAGTLGTGAVNNNGNLTFFRSDSITVPNDIAGSGTVTKSGAGTLILTGSNEYSGATIINAGTLQIGSGGTTGFPGTGMFSNNGILSFSHSDTLVIPNYICGSGEVRQIGSGTTALTEDNCYTGQTTISSGTLQLGNGGTSGSPGTGDIVNNANLAFKRSDYYIADNRITGSGTVNVNSGEFKLTSDNNDYSGITTIDSGAGLRIGYASSATGKPGTGLILDNGALDFDRSGSLTVGNAISGTGSVTQYGTGTTTLTSSTLSWSGDTSAHDGKLVFGTAVPVSDIWIIGFTSPSTYGQMALPSNPNLGSKTINVEIPASTTGPLDINVISWTGTASGTPTLMINGAVVTSGQYVGNIAVVFDPVAGVNVKVKETVAPVTTTTVPETMVPTTEPTQPPDGGDPGEPAAPPAVPQPSAAPPTVTNEVNVGGNSAVTHVVVTGYGVNNIVVTGTVQPGPPPGVDPAPGIAYQYIDLTPASYDTITGATITFNVPVSWLEENGLTPQNIVMQHYTGGAWHSLPTTVVSTANGMVTFTAATPSFSMFAIIAVERGTPPEPTAVQTFGMGQQAPATPAAKPATTGGQPGTVQPVQTQTTSSLPGWFHFSTMGLLAATIVLLASSGFLVRRWWVRRQNPGLFDEDEE